MEKEQVKIKISSRHDYGNGEPDPIEVISMGELYQDDEGCDCLSYEEVVEMDETGQVEVINNLLRIGGVPDRADQRRQRRISYGLYPES